MELYASWHKINHFECKCKGMHRNTLYVLSYFFAVLTIYIVDNKLKLNTI